MNPNLLLNSFYRAIVASEFRLIVPASCLKRLCTDGVAKLVENTNAAIRKAVVGGTLST